MPKTDALRNAPYGLEADGEERGGDRVSLAPSNADKYIRAPESRPWHEWTKTAERMTLDHCKRCGEIVCSYVRSCLPFAANFTADPRVAPETRLQHILYNGNA